MIETVPGVFEPADKINADDGPFDGSYEEWERIERRLDRNIILVHLGAFVVPFLYFVIIPYALGWIAR